MILWMLFRFIFSRGCKKPRIPNLKAICQEKRIRIGFSDSEAISLFQNLFSSAGESSDLNFPDSSPSISFRKICGSLDNKAFIFRNEEEKIKKTGNILSKLFSYSEKVVFFCFFKIQSNK